MTEPATIAGARAEAEQARARLMATAQELQNRLSPATIARHGWASAKEKGADLAEDAVDAVKRRPATTGGIIAALALFFARESIVDAAGRMIEGASGKRKERRTRKANAQQTHAKDGGRQNRGTGKAAEPPNAKSETETSS